MITETLKKKVNDSMLKKKVIAEKLGISSGWFSQCLNGSKDLSMDKVKMLEDILRKAE